MQGCQLSGAMRVMSEVSPKSQVPQVTESATRSTYARVAFLAAVSLLVAYVLRFNGHPWGDPESWGQLGDFFGGFLNPLIGIITVLLVLETLRVTRAEAADNRKELERQWREMEKQTALAREQAKYAEQQLDRAEGQLALAKLKDELQELQKCLDSVVDHLNNSLGYPLKGGLIMGVDEAGYLRFANSSWSKSAVVEASSSDEIIGLLSSSDISDYYNAADQWGREFVAERQLVVEIAHYCVIYDQRTGGLSWVTHYYKRRAYKLALMLNALKLISEDVLSALRPVDFPGISYP